MTTPYDPPKSMEIRGVSSLVNSILRSLGVCCLLYKIGTIFLSKYVTLPIQVFHLVVDLFLIIGFLRMGRKFFLCTGCYFFVTITLQAYFTQLTMARQDSIQTPVIDVSWLIFARSIVPHGIILLCSLLLFYRLAVSIEVAKGKSK